MKKKVLVSTLSKVFFALAALAVSCHPADQNIQPCNRIVLQLLLAPSVAQPSPANYVLNDNLEMSFISIDNFKNDAKWESRYAFRTNGYVKWIIYSAEPVKIKYGFGTLPVVSPGDSIIIRYDGEKYTYSGKGSDKLTCWNEMKMENLLQIKPNNDKIIIRSVADYFKWKAYLDNKLSSQILHLEAYKTKMKQFEYNFFKTTTINDVEDDRRLTFLELRSYSLRDSTSHLTSIDISTIWDSTEYNSWNTWLHSQSDYYGEINNITEFNKAEVWRKYGFDFKNDSLATTEILCCSYYNHAKQKYKGLLRERVLASLSKQAIKKIGPKNPVTQNMLKDYYNQPGFPEYKKSVKESEEKSIKLAKN